MPTAAIVVEIVSPDDETYEKFTFYADHGVDEIIVADPTARVLAIWQRSDEGYQGAPASGLLNVTAAELVAGISWPEETD